MQPEPDFTQTLNAMIPQRPKDAFFGLPACASSTRRRCGLHRSRSGPDRHPLHVRRLVRYAVSLKADRGRGRHGPQRTRRGARHRHQGRHDSRVGNSMVRDLEYSLSLRGGHLLGFKAVIRGQNDLEPAVPASRRKPSTAAMLPMVIRSIESGEDFIKFTGGCLRRPRASRSRTSSPGPGISSAS